MADRFVLTKVSDEDIRSVKGRVLFFARRRPLLLVSILLGIGTAMGLAGGVGFASVKNAQLHSELARQQAALDQVRQESQLEVNALAARLGELQAQANRLNALGERLTRVGRLEDGEFDFQRAPGRGGPEPAVDMPIAGLHEGMLQLSEQFDLAGRQLEVMDALLFDHEVDRNAVPSRSPVRGGYVTSGFGYRADPFGRGGQYHKGVDFDANVGDPVFAVADGVIVFAGSRNGYGMTVDVDHGNGYLTRYAHNSGLLVKEGDLVRAGEQIAKAGSTGRSTGAHVHLEVWENGAVVNPRRFLETGTADNTTSRRTKRG